MLVQWPVPFIGKLSLVYISMRDQMITARAFGECRRSGAV